LAWEGNKMTGKRKTGRPWPLISPLAPHLGAPLAWELSDGGGVISP
jgi:hypothetical protein